MKQLISLLYFFLIITVCEASITPAHLKSHTITIRIRLNLNSNIEKTSIQYYSNGWGPGLGFLPSEATLDKDKYTSLIQVDKSDSVVYLSLTGFANNNKYSVGYFNGYAAEPGDNVDIHIEQDPEKYFQNSLRFFGNGSDKYQCQYELIQKAIELTKLNYVQAKLTFKDGKLVRDSILYKNFIPELESNLKTDLEIFKARIIILKKYKSRISDFMYNLLEAQIHGSYELACIEHFRKPNVYFSGSSISPNYLYLIKDSLRKIYFNRDVVNFGNIKDKYLAYSPAFLRYKILQSSDDDNGYRLLRNSFSGFLRDRVIAGYFKAKFFHKVGADKDIDDALKFVKTDYCKSVLLSFNSALAEGRQAFDFLLPDSSGKMRKLSEFKGKVVIMDFWFTGCGACRQLTEKMKPILKQLENEKNFIFISVSVDKSIELWKQTLAGGLYTHEKSLNLCTALLKGREIIDHYGIFSYPTLIIIGKDGKIITGNPPRPDNSKESKALFDLLKNAINM